MTKKHGKRYTEQERAVILADMVRNGMTQAAAAKKHRVSAVTIWSWNRAARHGRPPRRTRAHGRRGFSDGTLDGLLRSQVRDRIREMTPEVVREEVASYVQRALGGHGERGDRVTRRPILVVLSLVTLLAFTRLASASCENLFEAQSGELWFIYNDVYPGYRELPRTPMIDSLYAADLRSMWDAMARGLATAAACQRRINADTRLAALLRKSPIHLRMTPGGPLGPASELDRSQPAPADSIFALFKGLDHDSTATLYTVRIGALADSASARRLFGRFAWLEDMRQVCEPMDSTMVLDWTHESCSIGECERPTLFMLPPAVSETGRWTVLSGLFVARRDANRWLAKIRRRGERSAEVAPIQVTGAVLSNAIP